MAEQEWFCENCKNSGVIAYEPRAGVYSVVIEIADAHRRASVGCSGLNGLAHVRVPAPPASDFLATVYA